MRSFYSVNEPQGITDLVSGIPFLDDFQGDAQNGDVWTNTVEADATAQSTIALEANQHGGNIKFTVGAVANDFANLATALNFHTASGRSMDLLVTIRGDNLDNWGVGFSDAQTETNGVIASNATVASAITAGKKPRFFAIRTEVETQ